MHSFRFVVSLRVFSQSVDTAEICRSLGLVPKWQHKIGESRATPKGASLSGIYESNYCSFDLERRDTEELHEMLTRTIDGLMKHKEFFHRIRDDEGRTEFFIGWYSSGNSGDIFSHDLLGRLSDLKIDVALDVYGGQ